MGVWLGGGPTLGLGFSLERDGEGDSEGAGDDPDGLLPKKAVI